MTKLEAVQYIIANDLNKRFNEQLGNYTGDVVCEAVTTLENKHFIFFTKKCGHEFVPSRHPIICTFRRQNVEDLNDFILTQLLGHENL